MKEVAFSFSLLLFLLNVDFGRCALEVQEATIVMDKGKCIIYGPIATVEEIETLKKCTEIVGDLEFAREAQGDANGTFKRIDGCLMMESTQLMNAAFLNTLEKIDCKPPERNRIIDNKYLCVEEKLQEKLKRIGNMTDEEFEIKHKHCPICLSTNLISTPSCASVVGDIYINESSKVVLQNVSRVYGRIRVNETDHEWYKRYIDNNPHASIPERRLTIHNLDMESDVAALVIENARIPPPRFFTSLLIKTYTETAISVMKHGYRMQKGLYYRIQTLTPNKRKVEAQQEEPGECYIPNGDAQPRYSGDDLARCKKLIGLIDFKCTTENVNYINWDELITAEKSIKITGGSELALLFSKEVQIDFSDDNFEFIVQFDKKVCWDVDVAAKARTWLPPKKHNRLKILEDPQCDTYVGHYNDYELRNFRVGDSRLNGKTIKGYLVLNRTTLEDYANFADGEDPHNWVSDPSRLKTLNRITKPKSLFYNVPVVDIVMCASKWPVPEFIFTVDLHSEREDDILLRVSGPAFKMSVSEYLKLKTKYGASRLDIDYLFPGECFFDQPLKDLSELDGCEVVIGDLRLNENTIGSTTTKIRQVTGCIHIVNTTLDNLDFFEFYSYYTSRYCHQCSGMKGFAIQNNSNLCVYHKEFFASRDQVHSNKADCGSELKDEEVVDRNFIFYDIHDQSELEIFNKVKEVNGKILFMANTAKNLTIFHKLERIHYRGVGPAIIVENNENLETFKFPSLKVVKVAEEKGTAILFKDNPKLKLAEKEKEIFRKAVGAAYNVTIETKKVKEEDKEEEVVKEDYDGPEGDRIDNMMGEGIWVGLGSSLGVVLLFVLIGVIVVVALQVKKKISSRKSKKGGKKGTKNEKQTAEEEKEDNGRKEEKTVEKTDGNKKRAKKTESTA